MSSEKARARRAEGERPRMMFGDTVSNVSFADTGVY